MSDKILSLQIFMTSIDEDNFSKLLLENFPHIRFIELFNWRSPEPPMHKSLAHCNSRGAIINEKIVSIDLYKKNLIFLSSDETHYTGSMIGNGLIQFLGSSEAEFSPGCLNNGCLAATYNPETEQETEIFVKAVWKLFKNNAVRLYWVNQETGQVNEKPESRFFAWPDAAEKYDGSKGNYLANHAFAYFVAKRK